MEASALHAPAGLSRFPRGGRLLRLRSDEQLVAAVPRPATTRPSGVIHDRYRQRLFAYVRQMLAACSRQDAEDVLQDVFVRAYGALRNDNREMNVRAWLYRVAHNRCIDHLRRPVPPAAEIFEVSRKPLHDPVEEAQRRDDLRRLVADVGNLPEQQRSALLMREIDGMTYADLADALDVTVPAVKSLLVRARVGLVEAAEARDADCAEIRADLLRAYDRGVKASGRARKHMRACDGCREYRARAARHAALVRRARAGRRRPARARGQAPRLRRRRCRRGRRGRRRRWRGRGRRRHRGGTACKVAAVVCTAAIATGGAVEVKHQVSNVTPRAAGREADAEEAHGRRRAKPSRRRWSPSPAGGPQVQTLARRAHRRGRDRRKAEKKPAVADKPRRLKAAPAAPVRPRRRRSAPTPPRPRRRPAARDRRRPRPGRRARADAGPGRDARGRRRRRRAADRPPRPTPAAADGAGTADGGAAGPAAPRRRARRSAARRARRIARLAAHRRLPGAPRTRDAARPPRTPLRPVHDGRRALDGARPRPRRLPDVDLRRLARRGPRRAAPVARDDLQGRGRRPAARRRQGRDHAAPGRGRAHARAPRGRRCRTSATRSRRSAAPT